MSQFFDTFVQFFEDRAQKIKGAFLLWNYFEQNMSIVSSTEKQGEEKCRIYIAQLVENQRNIK
ncbi:hypothetical protein AAW52_15870 [Vibrio diabolicus]|nr:hypothetical protein AAW52_15870 [Vibrio diabolicus]